MCIVYAGLDTYRDVYSIYKSPGIISVIKVRKSEWIKFVAKINNGRRVNKLPEGKPGGERKQGRPRLRWLDDVASNLMIMGVRIWKKVTVDGTE
jgi:hypothetical protein